MLISLAKIKFLNDSRRGVLNFFLKGTKRDFHVTNEIFIFPALDTNLIKTHAPYANVDASGKPYKINKLYGIIHVINKITSL